MNRFKRICGSIALTAALAIAGIGAQPAEQPALAAEVTIDQLGTELAAIGAKISELAKAGTLKTAISGKVNVMGSDIPFSVDMDVDATSKTGHGRMPLISMSADAMLGLVTGTELTYTDMYMDLDKNLMYIHDEKSGLNLVRDFPGAQYLQGFGAGATEGNMFTSMITPELLALMKDHTTITVDADTFNGVACQKVTLDIKYAKGEVVAFMQQMMTGIPESFKSSMSGFDANMFKDVAFDDKTVFYVAADHTPLKIAESCSLDGLSFGGMPLGVIKCDCDVLFSASADPIVIPADRTKNLVVAPGCVKVESGLDLISSIDSKNKAYFFVNSVHNAKATKITIPASIKAYDMTVPVTECAANAFKAAKKLKVLVVKNAKLKKAIKKNPSKYGLKKSVKIK